MTPYELIPARLWIVVRVRKDGSKDFHACENQRGAEALVKYEGFLPCGTFIPSIAVPS